MVSVVTLLWLTLVAQSHVVERAAVWPLENDASAPLFTFERTITPRGPETVVEVWFREPQGQIAVYEKVTYDSRAVVRYDAVQHQIAERYLLQVAGDEAVLEVERDGEISRSEHEWTDDTLTIDQIPLYVHEHWDALMRGDEVGFRLVALNRGRIVRFKIKKRDRTTHDGQPAVVLRMEAGNVFVRWLAPEIDLVFADDADKTFLESRGLLPVKVRRGDEWEDLEGRLVWER